MSHLFRISSLLAVHLCPLIRLLPFLFLWQGLTFLFVLLLLSLFSVLFQLVCRSRGRCTCSYKYTQYAGLCSTDALYMERPLLDLAHACLVTWHGGARCVAIAAVWSGRGGLGCGRGGPGGGLVHVDLRLELWETPPSVDVLKLLDLNTKHRYKYFKKTWHSLTSPVSPYLTSPPTWPVCLGVNHVIPVA